MSTNRAFSIWLLLMATMLIVALGGLGVRTGWLIRYQGDAAVQIARRQQRRVIPEPGRVGSILARSHKSYVPLAVSEQVPSCFADPALVDSADISDIALEVSSAIKADPLDVQEKIVLRRDRRFTWLKREIEPEAADAVRSLGFRAIGITHEWRRRYPCGDLASSVLGFRLRDGRPGGGLELTQQNYLAARKGRRIVRADASRRAIWLDPDESRVPLDGANVMLCLDAVMQEYLQDALKKAREEYGAKWASGVVMNPRTGEVLAMGSAPSFDPQNYNETPADHRVARSVSVPYEPGSVMKPIFASAAVDLGKMRFRDTIFCENGTYRVRGGGTVHDHDSHGDLNLAEVVIHSSNIGMAKVGQALGNTQLAKVLERFGFGQKTGISLPAESAGIIRPLGKWDGYSTLRVPYGHEMSVTTLQLATAFSALANGGELLKPRLVERVVSPDGKDLYQSQRRVVRRVLKRDVADQALWVLSQVVEEGTGRDCKLDKWTTFGKTGTAQIPGPGGYVDGAYAGSFVGGAPASAPKVICAITVYWPDASKGYYGGTVAAPAVKDVLRKSMIYLGVPPDRSGNASQVAKR